MGSEHHKRKLLWGLMGLLDSCQQILRGPCVLYDLESEAGFGSYGSFLATELPKDASHILCVVLFLSLSFFESFEI